MLSSPLSSRAVDGSPSADVASAARFVALACALTWALALPACLAWMRHEAPSPGALACAGLSAFGPLLAVLACARGDQRREAFGRWRTHPGWMLLALVTPAAIHLVATALYVALGGHPARWFYPPSTPEMMAALVVFPLGEEFGWRGFAHPRLVGRFGLVRGTLLVGLAWGLWHLAYSVTPQAAGFDLLLFARGMVELPLYALVLAWLFERSGRSMAVALAMHAGGHLDHLDHAPTSEGLRHGLHLVVVGVVALLAARALARQDAQRGAILTAVP